ncbi:ATP-binding cassette domain-containing protein [Kribbella monticola]|uniref:ATP-binding cassette domain-containing protein n=1 Tax=Kribbella monticola TaxID=2185285 RepID=UPI001E51BF7B|nr:ATP-binding cassette domain-containing protein [Kribbella monticola]
MSETDPAVEIAGLTKRSGDTLTVDGVDLLARIGSMIESPAFYPYLSGFDNLRLLAEYAEVPRTRIDQVLELVDLTDGARDRFSTYSPGMKQRLGVAAALLKDPELVILGALKTILTQHPGGGSLGAGQSPGWPRPTRRHLVG